jgi:hypothetical protein
MGMVALRTVPAWIDRPEVFNSLNKIDRFGSSGFVDILQEQIR